MKLEDKQCILYLILVISLIVGSLESCRYRKEVKPKEILMDIDIDKLNQQWNSLKELYQKHTIPPIVKDELRRILQKQSETE